MNQAGTTSGLTSGLYAPISGLFLLVHHYCDFGQNAVHATKAHISTAFLSSERSAARLAHQSGGLGVASSNLAAPTSSLRKLVSRKIRSGNWLASDGFLMACVAPRGRLRLATTRAEPALTQTSTPDINMTAIAGFDMRFGPGAVRPDRDVLHRSRGSIIME
jgi:hypothetical protein